MDPLSGIAVDIPDHVERGEAARLFPVLSESSREGRATSVLLATLTVVDTLADALFRRLGRPIGKRTKINCFTEIVLKSDPKFRPDGLIVIDSGREIWSALVECKIGKSRIEPDQLENYIRKARENEIDSVISISNELVADPTRPPISVDGRLTKTVAHFHYSWLAIRSEAEIAYAQALVSDPEKRYILAELIRFLSHPSAGVEGFEQMPAVWPDLIAEAEAGHFPKRSDTRLIEVVDAWLQQEKELGLVLSRLVSRRCISRSERKLRREGYDPSEEILREICDEHVLATEFTVPDAASEISIRADLRSKSTRVGMTLRAPEDRKRPEARLNWLLGQLKNADAAEIEIIAHWPGRGKSTFASLTALRQDPRLISDGGSGATPYAFEIIQRCHTPKSFAGRRRFVADLASAVQSFYSNAGRHLAAWSPRAPTPTEKTAAEQIAEDSVIDPERLNSIEQSLSDVLRSLGTNTSSGQEPARSGEQDSTPPSSESRPPTKA
jgi:hypothetical protein